MRDLAKLIDEILSADEYDIIRISRSQVSLRRTDTSAFTCDQMGEEEVPPSERAWDTFNMVLSRGRWEFMRHSVDKLNGERCEQWMLAGVLYEHYDTSMMMDEEYDQLSKNILLHYDASPEWFTDLVSKEDLKCGSFAAIEVSTRWHRKAKEYLDGKKAKLESVKPESKRRVARDDDDMI